MLKSKTRLLWIRWHAFISCFFLPFALLYALTGILYLFGIEGGPKQQKEMTFTLTTSWPEQEEEAKALALKLIPEEFLPLPQNYYRDGDTHGWWDFHEELHMEPVESTSLHESESYDIEFHWQTHNLMRQLLWIHKGLAGEIFKWLGILMGVSILFSLLSGALVSLSLPSLKRQSVVYLTLGSMTLLLAFFAS